MGVRDEPRQLFVIGERLKLLRDQGAAGLLRLRWILFREIIPTWSARMADDKIADAVSTGRRCSSAAISDAC
jgi:hypothetical protein